MSAQSRRGALYGGLLSFGRQPDVYYSADRTGQGGGIIGNGYLDGFASPTEYGTPTYGATGWQSSSPAIALSVGNTDDGIGCNAIQASRNADPDLPITVLSVFNYTGANYIFSWGNDGSSHPFFGVYTNAGHRLGFFARQNNGSTIDINILGTPTLTLSSDVVVGFTYDGSRFRGVAHDGTTLTEMLVGTSLTALSAANYNINDVIFGRRASNGTGSASMGGQIKAFYIWDDLAVTDAQLDGGVAALARHYGV